MNTRTYYEVLQSHNDQPLPAQAKKHGTPKYGYRTKNIAVNHCPFGCYIRERFTDGSNDWPGAIIWSI